MPRGLSCSLPLAHVVEGGVRFETGVPVVFPFLRNTEPSPYLGATYQQDIEPAGRYLLHDPAPGRPPLRGWEKGTVRLTSPLVLRATGSERLYDDTSWKSVLFEVFGRRSGAALSRAILRAGFDGVVTVRGDETLEIVDLTPLRRRR